MPTSSPEKLFRTACELLEQGDSRANELLPRLQDFPDYAAGWVLLGHTLSKLKSTEAAEVAYDQALAGQAAPVAAAIGKVDQMMAAGKFHAARRWLRSHRARWADNPALDYRLGRVCYALGHYKPAREAFNKVLEQTPDFAEAWFQFGLIEQDMDRPASAAAAYREALRTQPTMAEAALNLGISLQDAGDIEAALDAYAQALRIQPRCFNRIAQALTSAPVGRLWLNPGALRRALLARA